MTRSIWKGPFVHPSLLKKLINLKMDQTKKPIKTWSKKFYYNTRFCRT